MLPVGSMVAGYRIERVLATGGMGTVYLAENPTLPRYDAVKLLSAELSQDPSFRDRFLREADVASVLHHPNIVSIYSRGETDDGQLWISMQYVDGTDAEAALRSGTMTPPRAIHIVREVAKALDYAHQRNVVHHDVKPANFLLTSEVGEDEHVLLGDFGVAQALDDVGNDGAGSLTATLAYAAPEVITGGAIDGRADLYSLGCSLFRMLTGKKPFFEASGLADVAAAHLHQAPPRVSQHVPWEAAHLDHVVAKAMAKNPAQRYQSGREMADAAAAALREDIPPVRPSPPARGWQPPPFEPAPTHRGSPHPVQFGTPRFAAPPVRRFPNRTLLVGAAALLSMALVGGLTIWLLRPTPSPPISDITATTTSPSRDAAADAELLRLLPPGYPAGVCSPINPPAGTHAEVSCGPNSDQGGPQSATYTLGRDKAAVRAAFDEIVEDSEIVVCPGRIQSPGPWRRGSNPDQAQGVLFCGIRQGGPLMAWTDDARRLVASVQAGPSGPTLEQLYAWWSSHS